MTARRTMKSRAKRAAVWSKTGGYCWYCGKNIQEETMTIDHIVPICAGGDNRNENLVPACDKCNRAKGRLSTEGFRKKVNANLRGGVFYGERLDCEVQP